ncbi:hypothetical protein [Metabacillus sp. cB07]|uniref:hypothetical protein n=1 Tax=Metabacillus sp. cB07 TaxID=2806989 RepID=UPI00193930AA|nr:hypothetical protein [Metabacillus sp. cB07]
MSHSKNEGLVREILKNNSQVENILNEFDKSETQRYRDTIFNYIKKHNTYLSFRNKLLVIQVAIPLLGSIFAIFAPSLDIWVKLLILLVYLMISLLVFWIAKVLPEDFDKFNQEVTRLKLVNLSERLASKIALFDKIFEEEPEEDIIFLKMISDCVDLDISSLTESEKNMISRCINPSSRFENSRETNITISTEKINMSKSGKEKLKQITYELSSLAQYMFGGKGYSAKLYLRISKEFENKDVELLTSFSRFPLNEGKDNGTSWIKTRGNPSIVWECLERGGYKIAHTHERPELYYDSVLAICLPGRIGILALHADQKEAFDGKMDKTTYNLLALSTRQLVLEAISEEGERE